jgi:hypothetical protein
MMRFDSDQFSAYFDLVPRSITESRPCDAIVRLIFDSDQFIYILISTELSFVPSLPCDAMTVLIVDSDQVADFPDSSSGPMTTCEEVVDLEFGSGEFIVFPVSSQSSIDSSHHLTIPSMSFSSEQFHTVWNACETISDAALSHQSLDLSPSSNAIVPLIFDSDQFIVSLRPCDSAMSVPTTQDSSSFTRPRPLSIDIHQVTHQTSEQLCHVTCLSPNEALLPAETVSPQSESLSLITSDRDLDFPFPTVDEFGLPFSSVDPTSPDSSSFSTPPAFDSSIASIALQQGELATNGVVGTVPGDVLFTAVWAAEGPSFDSAAGDPMIGPVFDTLSFTHATKVELPSREFSAVTVEVFAITSPTSGRSVNDASFLAVPIQVSDTPDRRFTDAEMRSFDCSFAAIDVSDITSETPDRSFTDAAFLGVSNEVSDIASETTQRPCTDAAFLAVPIQVSEMPGRQFTGTELRSSECSSAAIEVSDITSETPDRSFTDATFLGVPTDVSEIGSPITDGSFTEASLLAVPIQVSEMADRRFTDTELRSSECSSAAIEVSDITSETPDRSFTDAAFLGVPNEVSEIGSPITDGSFTEASFLAVPIELSDIASETAERSFTDAEVRSPEYSPSPIDVSTVTSETRDRSFTDLTFMAVPSQVFETLDRRFTDAEVGHSESSEVSIQASESATALCFADERRCEFPVMPLDNSDTVPETPDRVSAATAEVLSCEFTAMPPHNPDDSTEASPANIPACSAVSPQPSATTFEKPEQSSAEAVCIVDVQSSEFIPVPIQNSDVVPVVRSRDAEGLSSEFSSMPPPTSDTVPETSDRVSASAAGVLSCEFSSVPPQNSDTVSEPPFAEVPFQSSRTAEDMQSRDFAASPPSEFLPDRGSPSQTAATSGAKSPPQRTNRRQHSLSPSKRRSVPPASARPSKRVPASPLIPTAAAPPSEQCSLETAPVSLPPSGAAKKPSKRVSPSANRSERGSVHSDIVSATPSDGGSLQSASERSSKRVSAASPKGSAAANRSEHGLLQPDSVSAPPSGAAANPSEPGSVHPDTVSATPSDGASLQSASKRPSKRVSTSSPKDSTAANRSESKSLHSDNVSVTPSDGGSLQSASGRPSKRVSASSPKNSAAANPSEPKSLHSDNVSPVPSDGRSLQSASARPSKRVSASSPKDTASALPLECGSLHSADGSAPPLDRSARSSQRTGPPSSPTPSISETRTAVSAEATFSLSESVSETHSLLSPEAFHALEKAGNPE